MNFNNLVEEINLGKQNHINEPLLRYVLYFCECCVSKDLPAYELSLAKQIVTRALVSIVTDEILEDDREYVLSVLNSQDEEEVNKIQVMTEQ